MGAIRESGDIDGTPGVELRTENGSVKLENGLNINLSLSNISFIINFLLNLLW